MKKKQKNNTDTNNGTNKHNQYEKFDAYIISENATDTNNISSNSTNNLSSAPGWLLKDDKKLEEKVTKQKEIYDNFKSKRSVLNRRLPITSSQSTPNFIVQQQHS